MKFGTGCNSYTMHLPVHAEYRAVHLWWCTTLGTMGDSAAADNEQHLTMVNDLAGISIGTLTIRICCTAVRSRTLDGRGATCASSVAL